jgi:hypothetical protein
MTIFVIVLTIVLGIFAIHLYDRMASTAERLLRLAARLEAPEPTDIPLLVALYAECLEEIDSNLDKLVYGLRTVLAIGIPIALIRGEWRVRKMLAASKRGAAVAASHALNLLLGLLIFGAVAVAIGVFLVVAAFVYDKLPHVLFATLSAAASMAVSPSSREFWKQFFAWDCWRNAPARRYSTAPAPKA